MKKLILLAALLTSVTACKKVAIENGIVPDKYLAEAKQLEGKYIGQFAGEKTELEIIFDGNKPQIKIKNKSNDLLHSECQSQIGDLVWVSVSNDLELKEAAFAFDSNNCISVEGKEFILAPYEKRGRIILDAGVFHKYEYVDDPFCDHNPRTQPICPKKYEGTWLTGQFKK